MQSLQIGSEHISYHIKTSSRARNVRLTVSSTRGLEIILPKSMHKRHIPKILADKQAWILQHLPQIHAAMEAKTQPLPSELYMASTEEIWRITYDATRQWGRRKWMMRDGELLVGADPSERVVAAGILRDWLRDYAEDILVPWLDDVAAETGLSFRKVTIRNQNTRWGSCSSTGAINLNQKLVFLPAEYVQYILVHELCHTKQMNHSAKFWQIVEQYLPEARKLDKRMRKTAQSHVPWWAHA